MAYNLTLTGIPFGSNPTRDFTVAVESFSFGAEAAVSGQNSNLPVFAPLTITKMLDAVSPRLYAASISRTPYQTVTLSLTREGGATPDATFTLTIAEVAGVTDSGSRHGGLFPTEQVTFKYNRIHMMSDGSAFGWDLIHNVGIP